MLTRWPQAEPWPAQRADYGRLAVLLLFDVPASAFTPPPNVTSSLVELVPLATSDPCDGGILSAATRAAFGQRRKMLRQSLKRFAAASGLDLAALLAAAGLDPTGRPEEIDIAGFVKLARAAEGAASRFKI